MERREEGREREVREEDKIMRIFEDKGRRGQRSDAITFLAGGTLEARKTATVSSSWLAISIERAGRFWSGRISSSVFLLL